MAKEELKIPMTLPLPMLISLQVIMTGHRKTSLICADKLLLCDRAWENMQVLSTQNTLVRMMAPMNCSVCAIQYLLVLLNSSWISAYTMTF